MANTLIGYIRVSKEKQAADGVSLEAQQKRIEEYATQKQIMPLALYIDVQSGRKTSNRPELQKAIIHACKSKSALVVYSLSRLARSTKDTIEIGEKLGKYGADLVSLSENIDTTTACGKMVFQLLAVLAEFERNLIIERTGNALDYKMERSERISLKIPYGWDLSPDKTTLVKNEKEQDVLSRLKIMREQKVSLRRMSEVLNDERIPTKYNGKWYPSTLFHIFRRLVRVERYERRLMPDPQSLSSSIIPSGMMFVSESNDA